MKFRHKTIKEFPNELFLDVHEDGVHNCFLKAYELGLDINKLISGEKIPILILDSMYCVGFVWNGLGGERLAELFHLKEENGFVQSMNERDFEKYVIGYIVLEKNDYERIKMIENIDKL